LLEFLSALGSREAIAFGDGVTLPVRIRFDELPPHSLPRSSTARFSEKWQKPVGDLHFLEAIVERWRAAGTAMVVEEDAASAAEMFPGQVFDEPAPLHAPAPPPRMAPSAPVQAAARPSLRPQSGEASPAAPARRPSLLRRDPAEAAPVAAAAPAPAAPNAAARPRTARDLLQGWNARR
jgi:hypothetical protein